MFEAQAEAAAGPDLAFSTAEFALRLDAVRTAMASRGIDTLVVVSPENMNYLTGYDGWSFYTPQCVVVPLEGDLIWIGRDMDVRCARFTTWLPEDAIVGYPEQMIGADGVHPMQFVGRWMTTHGWGNGSIGLERDSYYFSARAEEALKASLGSVATVDATGLVNLIRCVKSPAEIHYLRLAGQMAVSAMDTAAGAIAPGLRECDAVGDVFRTLVRGTPDAGGDVPWFPYMPTGRRTSTPHLTWTDKPFAAGQPVNIELGGCCRRYSAGLSRTIMLGQPSTALERLASIVDEGFERVVDTMRAGIPCEDVEAVWRGHLGRHGMSKESRIGYSIGLAYPPTWVEQSASLQRGDRTILLSDMVFHVIVGMWQDGDSYILSETIRVAEGAAESLTTFARSLILR